MKDCTAKQLTETIPSGEAMEAIDYCLDQLIKEKNKRLEEEVCVYLTYGELFGALLKAKYKLSKWQDNE